MVYLWTMSPRRSELVFVDGRVYHLGLLPQELAPCIFLVGDPHRAHLVAAKFENVTHQISNREYLTITGTFQGQAMSVIGTGIGTDNVEIALIEAYALLAFDPVKQVPKAKIPTVQIIRIGTSGGIQTDIAAGTMAITRYALGLDSTGLYYDHPAQDETITELEAQCLDILDQQTPEPARFKGKLPVYASKAHPLVHQALIDSASAFQVSAESGITVSAPGFYGPSGRYIKGLSNTVPQIKSALESLQYRGFQVINMEMESSLIFHLCGKLGIASGTICPIISNPQTHGTITGYKDLINKAIEIALNAMVKLRSTQSML